jgi:hypothetical protein
LRRLKIGKVISIFQGMVSPNKRSFDGRGVNHSEALHLLANADSAQ